MVMQTSYTVPDVLVLLVCIFFAESCQCWEFIAIYGRPTFTSLVLFSRLSPMCGKNAMNGTVGVTNSGYLSYAVGDFPSAKSGNAQRGWASETTTDRGIDQYVRRTATIRLCPALVVV